MPIFKLNKFPDVCRLCLKSNIKQDLMVPLSTKDEDFGGCTVAEFIQAFTYEISENKSHLLPKKVCLQCLDHLKFIAKHQSKLMIIHQLMDALAELKLSNPEPLKELFNDQSEALANVLKDLKLCTKSQFTVQDLLDEFPTYAFAFCSEYDEPGISCEVEMCFDQDLLADELGPEEMEALQIGPPEKRAKKEAEQLNDEETTSENADAKPKPKQKPVRALRKPRRAKKEATQLNKSSKLAAAAKEQRGQYICDTCGHQFKARLDMEQHQQRHLNKLDYACTYCNKCYNVEMDLKVHIKQRHAAGTSYKCDICELEFKSSTALNNHKTSHSDVYDFPCNLCEKKFKNATKLRRHRESVHEPRRHTCQHCSSAFANRTNLVDHVEAVHKIQMRFICDICVKTFLAQDDLDVHKSYHSNPAPLQCGTCLSVYPSEERLQDHLCITYRDDYICCARDFRTAYPYNTHMFKTHGQKTNVRVKPQPGVIYGVMKAQRKRVESCPKCGSIFPTRTQKKLHVESCDGVANNSS